MIQPAILPAPAQQLPTIDPLGEIGGLHGAESPFSGLLEALTKALNANPASDREPAPARDAPVRALPQAAGGKETGKPGGKILPELAPFAAPAALSVVSDDAPAAVSGAAKDRESAFVSDPVEALASNALPTVITQAAVLSPAPFVALIQSAPVRPQTNPVAAALPVRQSQVQAQSPALPLAQALPPGVVAVPLGTLYRPVTLPPEPASATGRLVVHRLVPELATMPLQPPLADPLLPVVLEARAVLPSALVSRPIPLAGAVTVSHASDPALVVALAAADPSDLAAPQVAMQAAPLTLPAFALRTDLPRRPPVAAAEPPPAALAVATDQASEPVRSLTVVPAQLAATDAVPLLAPDQGAAIAAAPAASYTTPAPPPHDFAALIDRLVEARQAAQASLGPQTVTAAVTHAEFGHVSLQFRQDGDGLSVIMAGADPDLARAVQVAAPVTQAGMQVGNDSNPPRQDGSNQQSASTSQSQPQAQQQRSQSAPQQADDQRGPANSSPRQREQADRQTDPASRGGIFA